MPFRVEIVDADSNGIRALRFTFERPLDDPGYRFFLGCPHGLAVQLKFEERATGPQSVSAALLDGRLSAGVFRKRAYSEEDAM